MTPAERARMAKLYRLGLSLRDVGKVVDRDPVTVLTHLRKADVDLRPRIQSFNRRPDLNPAELKRLYEDAGLGVDELAVRYDASRLAITQRLHEAGAVMRRRGRPRKKTERPARGEESRS